MAASNQIKFNDPRINPRPITSKEFGGSLLKNSNAKTARPISNKLPMHLVLRSEIAKGPYSFLKKASAIEKLVKQQAKKNNISVYSFANSGNHLHLLIKIKASNRHQMQYLWKRFIRSVSSLIARLVLGFEKSKAKGIKFWSHRPFTRILSSWVKDFLYVKKYLFQNYLETLGLIPYQPRSLRKSHNKYVNKTFKIVKMQC